jgi:hypothetical protein
LGDLWIDHIVAIGIALSLSFFFVLSTVLADIHPWWLIGVLAGGPAQRWEWEVVVVVAIMGVVVVTRGKSKRKAASVSSA